MKPIMSECRHLYEEAVRKTIKPEARGEFLKVGSPHWLDFKQGFLLGFDSCSERMTKALAINKPADKQTR